MNANSYLEFFFLLSQATLGLFSIACVEQTARRRLFSVCFVFLASALSLLAATYGFERETYVSSIYSLALLWSLFPLFFAGNKTLNPSRLDVLIAVQQSLLRTVTVFWSLTHIEEIKKYQLFEQFNPLSISLGVFLILAAFIVLKKLNWNVIVQSTISIFIIQMSLHADKTDLYGLLFFTMLFILGSLFMDMGSQVLRRLELVALGSGQLLALLIMVYETRSHGHTNAISWSVVLYALGVGSWFKNIVVERGRRDSKKMIAFRYTLQAMYILMAAVFFKEALPW